MGRRDVDLARLTACVFTSRGNFTRKQSGAFGLGSRLCVDGSSIN
jgi:hypothetical protein